MNNIDKSTVLYGWVFFGVEKFKNSHHLFYKLMSRKLKLKKKKIPANTVIEIGKLKPDVRISCQNISPMASFCIWDLQKAVFLFRKKKKKR